MSDNVIVLGAGSSFDADIPLSSGFVEKMREYAFTGKSNEGTLSEFLYRTLTFDRTG